MTGRNILISLCAVLVGIITAAAAGCVLDTVKVQGDSMEPHIPDGSRVFINRLAYFSDIPDKGDAVAFKCNVYSEDGEGSVLIRRVIAVSGDTVEIRDGILYVNEKRSEEYASAGVYFDPMERVTVSKGRVFVLSDTGLAAMDSRDSAVGQLRADELMGKVLFK